MLKPGQSPGAAIPMSRCPICKQSVATHARCRECGVLVGPSHLQREMRDGLCIACYQFREKLAKWNELGAEQGITKRERRERLDGDTIPLSPRQLEILRLAARGLTQNEIGARLIIAQSTVRNQMYIIFAKLGAFSTTHAVAIALRTGLIE